MIFDAAYMLFMSLLDIFGRTQSLVDCDGLWRKGQQFGAQEQVFLQQLYMETPEDGDLF